MRLNRTNFLKAEIHGTILVVRRKTYETLHLLLHLLSRVFSKMIFIMRRPFKMDFDEDTTNIVNVKLHL